MPGGLLYDLHADGCDGTVYTACRPVVVPDQEGGYHDFERAATIEVVLMAWCAECHAAEWEVV
jgi:hypothetical protein